MGKALVMHRQNEYSIEDVSDDITYDELKGIIGGWAEVALYDDTAKTAIFCDSDGHPKGLGFTMYRITDGHPLVGKLVWVSYENVMTDEGPDRKFSPLSQQAMNLLLASLKSNGWAELAYMDEDEAAKDGHLPGGGLGRV